MLLRFTVSFWQGRENSAHFRSVSLDGLGVDQDECNYRGHRAFIDPCVNRAALDQDITGPQMHDLIIFEFAIKLARQQNRVVHGFRAMRESCASGSEFVNSETLCRHRRPRNWCATKPALWVASAAAELSIGI
jgi:hypothetical protein